MSATPKKPAAGAPTGFVMPPIMTTISHYILFVPEARWQEAIAFYQNTIGLMLRIDEGKWAEFSAGGITFALHAGVDPRPVKTGIVFEVFHCDDAAKMLELRGVKITEPPKAVSPDGKRCFAFVDPFGNQLEGYGV